MSRFTVLMLAFVLLVLSVFTRGNVAVRLCFPVWFDPVRADLALAEKAEAYLRQTARLLGTRFHEDYYRTLVQTRLVQEVVPVSQTFPSSRACFDFLAEDDSANEVFAFLDEIEGESAPLPVEIVYVSGNSVNTFAEQLAPPVLFHPVHAETLSVAVLPVSAQFGFSLLLVIFLASVFLPIGTPGETVGDGLVALQDFFRSLAELLFVISILQFTVFARFTATPHGVGFSSLEQKRAAVLLR